MVAATLACTAVSVNAAKPTYVYGAPANLPLLNNAAQSLVRVGMPSDIPGNAVVSSAILTFTQYAAYTGANTLTVQRNAAAWVVSKATWNTRPALAGAAVSVSKTGSAAETQWSFDVTADVQGFVNGTVANNGWRLWTTSATTRYVRGSAGPVSRPSLTITYLTPTDAPVNLVPTGNQAVSLQKPWLLFLAPPDTTAINIQIDADMNSPYDFDSGDVSAVSGSLDMSTTAWIGLTAGGPSAYWRARTVSSFGYSAWSAWAQMRRVAKPTVTITSPGATSDDTTPPVTWTVSGGTQVSYRVIITNSAGKIVADSGQIVGTTTTYTPPKAVAAEGATATVEVRVWDDPNIHRVATPGDPVYASAFQTWTCQGVGSVANALTVSAVSDGWSPAVTVTATRGTAPDSWQVWRADGSGAPTSLATGLTNPLSYQDWTADPNKPHTYYAVPYINGTGRGQVGGAAPKSTVTPTCTGIWLVDPADPTVRAVIWGDEDADFDATEIAVIHQPIGGPPIRRVSYRPPLTGSVSGELVDVGAYTADAQITALYDFKSEYRDLRLILGDRNLLVRVGDILVAPTPDSDLERHSVVTFAWWQQGTTPWSP